MSDYIKREDALNASKIVYIEYLEIDDEQFIEGGADDIPVVFKKDIEKLPAACVEERRNGRWLMTPTDWIYCSECGSEPPNESNYASDYCPNCGAYMGSNLEWRL